MHYSHQRAVRCATWSAHVCFEEAQYTAASTRLLGYGKICSQELHRVEDRNDGSRQVFVLKFNERGPPLHAYAARVSGQLCGII